MRILPHVPRLIRNKRALAKLSADDIQSTGLLLETMARRQPQRTMTSEVAETLYEIMDDCVLSGSLIITSQYPTN